MPQEKTLDELGLLVILYSILRDLQGFIEGMPEGETALHQAMKLKLEVAKAIDRLA